MAKNLPANPGDERDSEKKKKERKKETPVRSLGQEDPLEYEMATTPVFLPGKFLRQRSLVGYR